MTTPIELEPLTQRLDWLFEIAPISTGTAEGADRTWRPGTALDVGYALATAGLAQTVAAGCERVAELRSDGGGATSAELSVIADVFGIDVAYFGPDGSVVAEVRERVLQRALRGHGVTDYRICRTVPSGPDRREQIRRVLRGLMLALPIDRGETLPPEADAGSADIWTVAVTGPLSDEQIRGICHDLVTALRLRPPFTPAQFCRRLSRWRGRPIKLRDTDLGSVTSIGHVAPQHRRDLVVYDQNAPAPQERQVIYHEVMHLLRRHLDVGEHLTCGSGLAQPDEHAGKPGEIMTPYADWIEREAEVGGRELARLAELQSRPCDLPGGTPAEQQLAGAFGFVAEDGPR